jgi:hypothetical protein
LCPFFSDDDDEEEVVTETAKKISDPKIDAKVLKLKAQLDSIKNISDEENSESARLVDLTVDHGITSDYQGVQTRPS